MPYDAVSLSVFVKLGRLPIKVVCSKVVPWLIRFLASLSRWNPGFNHNEIHVSSSVDYMALRQGTGRAVGSYVCIAVLTLDAGLPARSQYPEGPATGHLDTGFAWFPCVYKRMLRWFPSFQVANTCLSCSPPDLKFLVTYLIFVCM